MSLDVQVPRTCGCCGGRGEVWSEPCGPCDGKGQELLPQRLTVAVPAGVADGDRFSFTLWLPRGPRTRVDCPRRRHRVKRHVEFLSTLYVTWGAIFALVAVAGFALAGGAFAIARIDGTRCGSDRRWPRA